MLRRKLSNCELQNQIPTSVHAERLLKRAFNVVRAAVFQVCDVRLQFRTFWGKKGPIFGNKD